MARFLLAGCINVSANDENKTITLTNVGHSPVLVEVGGDNLLPREMPLMALTPGTPRVVELLSEGVRITTFTVRSLVTELLIAAAPLDLIETIETIELLSGGEFVLIDENASTVVYPS
jgi:hypothetical protein